MMMKNNSIYIDILLIYLIVHYSCTTKALVSSSKLIKTIHSDQTAQSSLLGRVIVKDIGTPLQRANISILDTEFRTVSDKNGDFKIDNLPPGNYNIKVQYFGLQQHVFENLLLNKNETVILEFSLVAEPVERIKF